MIVSDFCITNLFCFFRDEQKQFSCLDLKLPFKFGMHMHVGVLEVMLKLEISSQIRSKETVPLSMDFKQEFCLTGHDKLLCIGYQLIF